MRQSGFQFFFCGDGTVLGNLLHTVANERIEYATLASLSVLIDMPFITQCGKSGSEKKRRLNDIMFAAVRLKRLLPSTPRYCGPSRVS